MSRTRRRHPAPDDPRLPRKLRQDSGVNLMYQDDWYGFNVANKMPTRGDTDPALNPFTGLPGTILEVNSITGVEIAPLEVDTVHQKDNSTTHRVLAPDAVLNANIGEQIQANKLPDIGDLYGSLGAGRLVWSVNVVPKFAVSGVAWDKVDDKPNIATKHYVDTTADDIKRWVRKNFKKI